MRLSALGVVPVKTIATSDTSERTADSCTPIDPDWADSCTPIDSESREACARGFCRRSDEYQYYFVPQGSTLARGLLKDE